jgi:NitT/TauT family transport system substrate-binding protein
MKKTSSRCWGAALLLLLVATPAVADDTVTVGIYGATSDAPFFVAEKKGYFKEEGIIVKMSSFQSAAMMVPPLGTGQLDVGAGSASAGLYNAVARGIKIRIVADKASSPPGYGGTKLLVRKELVDSGRYKSFKDLKGLKIATNAPGVSNTSTLNDALKSVGLKYSDVKTIDFASPMDHVAALKNGSVDGAAAIEPAPTLAVEDGSAVVVGTDDVISPYHQIAVLLYSQAFAGKTALATRFMRAYIRAVRFYNEALKDGHLAGPTSGELISILTEYTRVNAETYRKVTPTGMNPDGNVNVDSLDHDLAFYTEQGLVKEKIKVDELVDMSFARAAVKSLGPYKKLQ